MLTALEGLCRDTDGRYATDEELQFLLDYTESFQLRLSTYHKIHSSEVLIMQQVRDRLRSRDPVNQVWGSGKYQQKCQDDTMLILRNCALAMLLDDYHRLRDRLLLWLQTMMAALNKQNSCRLTCEVMAEVLESLLTPEESKLICAILEENCHILKSLER
ncbi:hypothetical protein [Roseofilum casamattae]|uniref:Phycobilisome protein n=1 Tax=Roseofilum casamattae BLCC-M143 TaxID=3022442 RepID=A0ABT7BWC0_9CYAN|nr:hypothetical protein [Roseofilum casamattae]MDJ1183466.1 phycobilisome protein [Roseofilum casamattae BLCC-M143]